MKAKKCKLFGEEFTVSTKEDYEAFLVFCKDAQDNLKAWRLAQLLGDLYEYPTDKEIAYKWR